MTVNGSSDIETLKEVSILRATLLKCLACNLCDSLLRDATTISECLHSFCSDCITAKLSDGETETCPVCEVHLGPLPLEKLRPDHHLDVLTEKLFSKKRKLVASSNGNGTRRKERSLSSLGAQGPPAFNPGYASRQTRALSSSDDDEADISDDDDDSPTTTSLKREDFFRPDSSDEAKPLLAGTQNVSEGQRTGKCSLSPGLRFPGFVSGLDALASLSVEPKLTLATPPDGGSRPNGLKKRPSNVRTRRPSSSSRASSTNGIWFVLESGDLQTNEDALPPLASPYMRVKDGKMSVNHVKQYLVHKLSHKLSSEMDVEITCRGNRVVSSLPLETIRDIWYAHFSHEATQAKAETSTVPTIPSTKDILMVLTYKRKTLKS